MKNNKFWTYFNKKGYYVILSLCILTILVTTFITRNNLNTLDKVNEENYIDLDEEYGTFDLEDVGTINAYQNDLDITNEDIAGSGTATAEDLILTEEETAKEESKDLAAEEEVIIASNNETNNNIIPLPVAEETKEDEKVVSLIDEEPDKETVETFHLVKIPLFNGLLMVK